MNTEVITKSKSWAMDLRRYQRQEQSQGQLSPTDAAFLTRLLEFLDISVEKGLKNPNDTGQFVVDKSRSLAMDVRRYQRQEQNQGHLSPTDAALLTRILEFLEKSIVPLLEAQIKAFPKH